MYVSSFPDQEISMDCEQCIRLTLLSPLFSVISSLPPLSPPLSPPSFLSLPSSIPPTSISYTLARLRDTRKQTKRLAPRLGHSHAPEGLRNQREKLIAIAAYFHLFSLL